MAQIAGGRVFQMLWTANSKRTPSKLSPGSSNDSSSGGCGTKSPLIADGVELDEVGQIHWTPLVKNLMHQRCKLEFDMVLNRQPVNLVGLPWYVTGGQDPAPAGRQRSAHAEVASVSTQEGQGWKERSCSSPSGRGRVTSQAVSGSGLLG